MFEQFISAMPIKMEQRLTEEEELARELKREAAIFFPDRRQPDVTDPEEESEPVKAPDPAPTLGRLPEDARQAEPPKENAGAHSGDHRPGDPQAKYPDAVSQRPEELGEGESDYEARNASYSKAGGHLGEGESEYEGVLPVPGEIGTERETEQEHAGQAQIAAGSHWAEGIRLAAVLDKPRALKPWGGEGL